jgi:hypothetical protein
MKMKMTTKKRKAKNRPLFTIGYEQAKPTAVLNELKRAKIELLVDTRAVAASRRPGFSKRQLAASLEEAGIAYIHRLKAARQRAAATRTPCGAFTTSTSGNLKHSKNSASSSR